MHVTGNTVLITGGATGIGLALATAFLEKGNTVLICGRREDKLNAAQARHPGLIIRVCDVGNADERQGLFDWAANAYPGLNILVNNAGIQREIDFRQGVAALEAGSSELSINLEGVIYLTALFTPHLMNQPQAAIFQVSSGLAFIPMAIAPLYCATKAALHSFSLSLRQQLATTAVKVFEIIPPIVETELDQGARQGRAQPQAAIAPEAVARQTLKSMANDQYEIVVGRAAALRFGSRIAPKLFFKLLNRITTK